MAVDIYQIPHALSVYVDRTKGGGVLHVITSISDEVITSISDAQEKQKREMTDAIQYTLPRIGLRDYKVHWNAQNVLPFGQNVKHQTRCWHLPALLASRSGAMRVASTTSK